MTLDSFPTLVAPVFTGTVVVLGAATTALSGASQTFEAFTQWGVAGAVVAVSIVLIKRGDTRESVIGKQLADANKKRREAEVRAATAEAVNDSLVSQVAELRKAISLLNERNDD